MYMTRDREVREIIHWTGSMKQAHRHIPKLKSNHNKLYRIFVIWFTLKHFERKKKRLVKDYVLIMPSAMFVNGFFYRFPRHLALIGCSSCPCIQIFSLLQNQKQSVTTVLESSHPSEHWPTSNLGSTLGDEWNFLQLDITSMCSATDKSICSILSRRTPTLHYFLHFNTLHTLPDTFNNFWSIVSWKRMI